MENPGNHVSIKVSDKEKAEILQEQFSRVFTKEPEGEIPFFEQRTDIHITDVKISEEMVQKKLNELNTNKSCGPDEIHPRLLKELSSEIAGPIAIIMNKSLEDGQLQVDWKKAFVSPIYKNKGNKNHAENYRPISLTSVVCKLMEKFIKEALMHHLNSQNLLSTRQYGFINGRSTTTQLLSYINKCVDVVADKSILDVIYFDFSKAFDTVPHRRLITKLKAYGIHGKTLHWIEDFLKDRTQIVKVNGENSRSAPVISGIPQGSVLGPVLFLIYINDLPDLVTSDMFLFADDTKILREIRSKEDSLALQNDIDALEVWSQKWLLTFHPNKCHVLTIGKHKNIKHTHKYELYGKELEHVSQEKDLGVTIDSHLTFEEHINLKIKSASTMAGLIRRTFSFLDGKMFVKLFTALARPHLEYSQAVWAPHLVKHRDLIERVQRRATKQIDGLKNLSYEERLKEIGLPTLAYRRKRGDMIEVFKHFETYDRSTLSTGFQPRNKICRRHDRQLEWNIALDGIRGCQRNSFYYRIAKHWNELPRNVAMADNINSFKSNLDKHWQKLQTQTN